MATLASSVRHLKGQRQQLMAPSWRQAGWRRSSPRVCIQALSTESSDSVSPSDAGPLAVVQSIPIPFQGVKHARLVPSSPSYFSRTPTFNDLFISVSKLLAKYHHLPTVPANEAPHISWTKLEKLRSTTSEPVKASQYSEVARVARRLNLIQPSVMPLEVQATLAKFSRNVDPFTNTSRPLTVDKFGRALGTGKRKESTARAFVVEGTGEILINGKPLNEAFGRVHDRESAIWALTATGRLDKYNVWALVAGGGTTGQAEALTLAVAKGLLTHEPALKAALRKAGCMTRDARTVERKKHGHVKARKMPAWVKR